MSFRDRVDAGRRLADALGPLALGSNVVVLGLPRGGVPVAAQVAAVLQAPLDVIVVRKLGLPGQPEVAMGAIGEEGAQVLNPRVADYAGPGELDRVVAAERLELAQRLQLWRAARPSVPLSGRTVVIVDDGVATGATVRAACQVARARGASRIVVGVPVAPPDTVESLRAVADDVVAVLTPDAFAAVGQWYDDFAPTTDSEVTRLLSSR